MAIKNFFKKIYYFSRFFLITAQVRILDRFVDTLTFLFAGLGAIVEILITLVFFESIYTKIDNLAGWERGEMIILIGLSSLIKSISMAIYHRSLHRLQNMIHKSDLDMVITKPINTQFYLSIFNMDVIFTLPHISFSLFLIYYGVSQTINSLNWLAFIPLTILAVISHYSLICLLQSINFYFNFSHTYFLTSELEDLGRFPRNIYKFPFNLILSIIIPITLIYSIPVEILTGKINWLQLGPILLSLIIFNIIAQLIFSKALQSYESNKI